MTIKIIFIWCSFLIMVQCSNLVTLDTGGGASETINAQITVSDTLVKFQFDKNGGRWFFIRIYSDQYRPQENISFADSIFCRDSNSATWISPVAGVFNFILKAQQLGKYSFISNVEVKQGVHDTIRCILSSQAFEGIVMQGPSNSHSDSVKLSGSLTRSK